MAGGNQIAPRTKPAEETASQVPDRVHKQGSLAERASITVRPGGRGVGIELGELWHYRELLYFLTWRDVKVRYKQTALGAAWAVIQPLFVMLIFTIFFGKLARVPSEGLPYPVFAYAGLLPWIFFANAVTNSGNSLIESSNLITKVYFPRLLIPGAAVVSGLVDFLIACVVLIPLMLHYRVAMTWKALLFPVLVGLTMLLALGVGMYMAALNVKYRDIRYALPFVIQLGMFVSPVIYPSSLVPDKWRWVLALNPLTGIIEGYRACLLGVAMDWRGLGVSSLLVFAVFIGSLWVFRRAERTFADII